MIESLIYIIGAAVVAYLIVLFIMHKVFEKFFMMLLFLVSITFMAVVVYLVLQVVK